MKTFAAFLVGSKPLEQDALTPKAFREEVTLLLVQAQFNWGSNDRIPP